MHFVGASLLGTGALHPVGPEVSVLDTERSAGSVCSMRSTVSSLATTTDPDSLSTRVAKLEVWTADISTQIDAIGPSVAEQIDTLRKALADEHSERQLAHKTLLKSIEALGLEDVVASVSGVVKQKLASDLSSLSAELGAKVEVLKVQLEARVHDVETRLQKQGRLDEFPRTMQGLQEQLDAMHMKVLATEKKGLEQSAKLATVQENAERAMKSASDCAKVMEQKPASNSDLNTTTVVDRVGVMMHEKLDSVRAQWNTALEEERANSIERIRVKLDELRNEWQTALEEERQSGTERTRTLGRTLAEEFEKSTVAQAVAESRTEACTVACDILSKELETWDQTRCSRAELSQVSERVTVAEDRLKEIEKSGLVAPATKDAKASSAGLDQTSLESLSILSATVSGLDHRLGALCKDLQSVQTSLQTEVAHVRTDLRKQATVDVHAMQTTVQKLLLQSESVKRELESSEKLHREALERETRERMLADEKVGRACLEQLREQETSMKSLEHETKSHVALLRDVLPLLGNREQQPQQQQQQLSTVSGLPPSTVSDASSSAKLDLRLQGRLQSLLAKLNKPGFEELGPDLRQLSSLLGTDAKRGDSVDLTGGSGRSLSCSSDTALTRQQFSPRGSLKVPVTLRAVSEERRLQDLQKIPEKSPSQVSRSAGSSSDHGDAPGGLTLDALKEDIMVYLKSEFQDQISERLKNMNPQADTSPSTSHQPVRPISPRGDPRSSVKKSPGPQDDRLSSLRMSQQLQSRPKMPNHGSPLQSSLQPSVKSAAPKAGHSLASRGLGFGSLKLDGHARSTSPAMPSMMGSQSSQGGSAQYPVAMQREGKFVLRPRT